MKTGTKNNKVISISGAADRCNVSRATIWRWIKIGQLKAAKTAGGHYRILKTDLKAFIREKNMHPQFRTPKAPKRILVVDDDPVIFKYFRQLLNKTDYLLQHAANGFDAGIKIMRFRPDLVLLDLILPDINGFEVCRQIRKNPDMRHIKIIAITGHDTKENQKHILAAGADLFLPKPFNNDRALTKIKRFLAP